MSCGSVKQLSTRFAGTALPRHLDAPVRQVDFASRVRIRINAHDASNSIARSCQRQSRSRRQGLALISTVDAVFGAGFQNSLGIDFVAGRLTAFLP
jgi:hypothetical protein